MARSIRIQYPGAFYHVMARGNRREAIFHDDDDRRFFLHTLAEACGMTGWRVHAWVLMGNHYHLCLETPEANLVAGMSWLQNALTRRYNVRHRKWGRLFGDRYKAVSVEGGCGYHYRTLLDYIHLNPVRAKLIRPAAGQSVLDYPWSSLAGGYALPPGRRAAWLAAGDGLAAFALHDTAEGRRKMTRRLDERAVAESFRTCGVPPPDAEVDARLSHLRRGWYWGTQAFGEKLRQMAAAWLQRKEPRSRAYRKAKENAGHSLAAAERLLREALLAAELPPEMLPGLKGSDPRKVLIAEAIWQGTIARHDWLAERLSMKSSANVGQQLRRLRADRKRLLRAVPASLRTWLDTHTSAK